MKKKFFNLMLIALVLPVMAWGQNGQTNVLEWGHFDLKYIESPQDMPDYDNEGRSWTELNYDDSSWSIASSALFQRQRMQFNCFFRVVFSLSEIKDNVNYYIKVDGKNDPNSFLSVNGYYIGVDCVDTQIDYDLYNYYRIPQSYLKEGDNILALSNTYLNYNYGWRFSIVYDELYYDIDGTILDYPIVATDVSALGDAIYLEPLEEIRNGKDLELQIKMKNSKVPASYQFTIIQPWGIELQEATLDETRHDGHRMTINDGKIVVFSPSQGELSGTSGAIINLKLHVDRLSYIGTVPIKITNASYVNIEEERVNLPSVTIPMSIVDAEKGDANNDEIVTVADVVAIVNNIVGKENVSFNRRAADLNSDGIIDIVDVQMAINKVVGGDSSRQAPREDMYDPE